MKKFTTLLVMLASFTFFSSSVLAVEAEGTIDEVRVCGMSNPNHGWRNYIIYKLSTGQWFYSYVNYGDTNYDYDSNFLYSHIMTAYSSRYKVKIKASDPIDTHATTCGVSSLTAGLSTNLGDYISIIEYSQP